MAAGRPAGEGRRPLGLTGGIGAGKSSVAGFLRVRYGLRYIDADVVCRELLSPGAAGWLAVTAALGNSFLDPDGNINRPRLRQAIFQDQTLRRQLDALLHPLARQEVRGLLAQMPDQARCLVEVPLLYEAGWENEFDRIVVVYASPASCRRRLMQRDRVSAEAAQQALAAQLPLVEKALRAEHVVDNSGPWPETCLQLLHLGRLLRLAAGEL